MSSKANPYLYDDAILYQVSVWGSSHNVRGGQIPTFLLNSQIQMICNSKQAAEIAFHMFPSASSVTIMPYSTGVPENFNREEI
jgi:hypothetical protein